MTRSAGFTLVELLVVVGRGDAPSGQMPALYKAADSGKDRGYYDLGVLGAGTANAGTATANVDYALSGTALTFTDAGTAVVTLPDGSSTATVTLTAFQDSRTENTESATFTLKSHPSYKLGSPATAAVNITDDDSTKLPANGYTITDLGLSTFSAAYALNDNATPSVVGNYVSGTGYAHGYRKTGSVLTDLGVIYQFPGAAQDYTYAYGVNNSDVIVGSGFSYSSGANPSYRPYYFRWSGGVMTQLAVPGAVDLYQAGPMAVNNAGWIVGFTRNTSGTIRAGRWDANRTQRLMPGQ